MRFSYSCCLSLTVLWSCLTCCITVSSGCKLEPVRAQGSSQANHQPHARRGDKAVVRSLPEYQRAAALFSKGDKAGAKLALEVLLKTPRLSPADTAFLKTQLALCEKITSPSQPPSPKGKGGVLGLGDCGPRALQLAARGLGVKAELAVLTKAAKTNAEGTSLEGLVAAAKSIGLKAEGIQVDRDALARLSTPFIAWWEGNHFVAVLEIKENAFNGEVSAIIHDPNKPEPKSVKLADLLAKSGGIVLTLKK